KFYHTLEEKKPQWSRAILRREANRFWHPPDSKALPGHCTGGAVDVSITDAAGNPLDMVSQTREGYSTLATYSCYLTPEAKANRALLIEVMAAAGFSNCADEWWHWSYGDSCWAGRVNAPQAIYAIMPPPVAGR
ncbi:MAG TPA: M15 family metallopeptidase, partial [Armatimonadota bacterium]|nr:M15 family metallopeptidase [Armatimonadota bacterium]